MDDWVTQAADVIEETVATVRERTVVPVQKATRAVVHGLLVTFFVVLALALFAIGLFRGLTIATDRAWASYAILGGIFVLAGSFCWAQRTRQPKDDR